MKYMEFSNVLFSTGHEPKGTDVTHKNREKKKHLQFSNKIIRSLVNVYLYQLINEK